MDVRDDGSRTTVVLADGDTRMAVVHVVGPKPPDLTVVSAVARLRLMALRMGWTVRIENPCFHLCELLELTGLSDVLLAPRQRRPGDGPCPDAGPQAELDPWPRLDLEDLLADLRKDDVRPGEVDPRPVEHDGLPVDAGEGPGDGDRHGHCDRPDDGDEDPGQPDEGQSDLGGTTR